MAVHHKDKSRSGSGRYRLLGVNHENRPYFFWSDEPAKYAAYIGPSAPFGVWGTLNCGNGKRMKPENRVFIADYETARRLEILGVVGPCGQCNREEYARYKADGTLTVDRHVAIE